MVPRLRSRIVPALFLLAVGAPRPVHAQLDPVCPVSFQLESVDTLGAVGAQTSIVTDPRGSAHVAYRNTTGSQIRYAHQEAGQWTIELLPQRGASHGLSLALDPTGVPYIGYGAQEQTPFGIVTSAKIAWKIGDIWTTERIEEDAFPGECSIGFDPAGVLHAVYFAFIPAFVIRYATRTPEGWVRETAFATGGSGAGRFSLAFDPEGRPHVTAQVRQVPLHLVRDGTGWVIDRQPSAEVGALAVGADGIPHLAAHLVSPPVVQYRTRLNGTWSIETVDSAEVGGDRAVSLALDRFGRPFLCYYDETARMLKIAWKDRGIWWKQLVDVGGLGEAPSIALADGAEPRIGYMDPASFDLRVASGEIAPPNHAPVADAGGPYSGTVGQMLSFDASRSSDPDGDRLAYAWDFGDAIQGRGPSVAHVYGAAGVYRVCLSVRDEGCPSLEDSTCVDATIQEALAARVFQLKDKKIELEREGDPVCLGVEPMASDFVSSDVDPSTFVAKFGEAQVSPSPQRSHLVADSDENGASEIRTCFSVPSLRTLFAAAPPGRSQVTLRLEGSLRSGARVRGEVECEIQKHRDCRDGCAEVSPNPLNPSARITFTLFHPGSVAIDLFDAQGRRLGPILRRTFLPAGDHEQAIEARSLGENRPLSSGVYFYRIETPDGPVNGRFTILK